MVRVELITTGDEILTGEVMNTNATWIADACREVGAQCTRHVTVGDDLAAIGAACREAVTRADIVVCTGGLGPTSDDITLDAAAQAFNVPLVFHEALWAKIEEWFAGRGRPCSASNRKMAHVPQGAQALHNPVGLAFGVQWVIDDATCFFFPGVPKEMEALFVHHVRPLLASAEGGTSGRRRLHCFGVPEATIGERIAQLDLPEVRVGYRVVYPETMVKLVGPSHVLDAAEAAVRAVLGAVVYGSEDDTLASVVGEQLITRGYSLAVAESCTGGAIADCMTNTPGASQWFERGVVSYSDRAKRDLLAIPASLIEAHGAVSQAVAEAMATAVRLQSGATYGLSVTGIAGPTGGSTAKPVGTTFIGLATPEGTTVEELHYPHDRISYKRFITYKALDRVRKVMV